MIATQDRKVYVEGKYADGNYFEFEGEFLNQTAIANKIGCSKSNLSKALAAGVKPEDLREHIEIKWGDKRFGSYSALAKHLGCALSTIRNYIAIQGYTKGEIERKLKERRAKEKRGDVGVKLRWVFIDPDGRHHEKTLDQWAKVLKTTRSALESNYRNFRYNLKQGKLEATDIALRKAFRVLNEQ